MIEEFQRSQIRAVIVKDGIDLAGFQIQVGKILVEALHVSQGGDDIVYSRHLRGSIPAAEQVHGVGLRSILCLGIGFLHLLEDGDQVFQSLRFRAANLLVDIPADIDGVNTRVNREVGITYG